MNCYVPIDFIKGFLLIQQLLFAATVSDLFLGEKFRGRIHRRSSIVAVALVFPK
jgi:hypothetical protein